MGTLLNAIAIIVGGSLGLLLKKYINEKIGNTISKYLGIVLIVLSLGWALSKLIYLDNNTFKTKGELMLLLSIIIGGLIGELLKFDEKINNLSIKIEKRFKINNFSNGFVASTLLFAIGAMTILGPIQEAVSGDMTLLIVKSTLDFISAIILASTLGYGVIFSSIPILIIQGAFFLAGPYLNIPPTLLDDILLVGYVIIFTIGLNLTNLTKIKTANLLPALLMPILINLLA